MDSFVGRQAQVAALRAKFDAARKGRGSIVMLSGEPGIGKTRLAREFAVSAEAQGAAVLTGGCYEGDWQPPYNPWREALGGYARSSARTATPNSISLLTIRCATCCQRSGATSITSSFR